MYEKLILSLFFGDHDSNITIATKSRVLLHVEAERVFGEKHLCVTAEQMDELVQLSLQHLGAHEDDIEEVLVAKWSSKYDLAHPVRIGSRIFTPVITGHHQNHIGTARPSGFDQCLVLCADGWSEDGATSMYLYEQERLDRLALLEKSFLVGRVYATATQMTVQPNYWIADTSDTGKMMGLSAFGRYDRDLAKHIRARQEEFNTQHLDGVDDLLQEFGLSPTYAKEPDTARRDFAATVQTEWERELLAIARRFRPLSSRIALVGGCAMNVVANGRLANSGIFEDVFVPAMPADAGQSLGAIWARYPDAATQSAYLGRDHGITISQSSVQPMVDDLIAGRVLAIYSGPSESGPRALGNRSILALPRDEAIRIRISEDIKRREAYRPIAPMVRAVDLSRFFKASVMSPYMTYAFPAREETKARAPAIVHADGTSRVQTLCSTENPFLHAVLGELEARGETPILANTSMNVAGRPMVDTPDEAQQFFDETPVDVLYLGDTRLSRVMS